MSNLLCTASSVDVCTKPRLCSIWVSISTCTLHRSPTRYIQYNPIITYLSQQKASCRSNIYVSGVGDIIYLKIDFKRKCLGRSFILNFWWYINADLKVSLYYVRIHLKIIPWKFRTLNPNKFSSYLPAKFAFFLKN